MGTDPAFIVRDQLVLKLAVLKKITVEQDNFGSIRRFFSIGTIGF